MVGRHPEGRPPVVFSESGMRFHFPSDWLVRRYDQHTYFRGFSGYGLKGVDFVAVEPSGRLWLVEAKNFIPRQEFPVIIKSAAVLGAQLLQKAEDTVRGIAAVHAYRSRSFWYRWLFPHLHRLRWLSGEWLFWARAYRALSEEAQIVCCLAMRDADAGLYADLASWSAVHWPADLPRLQIIRPGQPGLAGISVTLEGEVHTGSK